MDKPLGYTFHGPCRRPKDKFVIRPTDSVGGYKGRASYLCDALNLRWSQRAGGYVATASKLRKFEKLYAEGWNATLFGRLLAPGESACAFRSRTEANSDAI